MVKLSDEKIEAIQKRYAEIGIYSQVAKELGCSPATVKKYVSDGALSKTVKKDYPKFTGQMKPVEDIVSPLTIEGWLRWVSFTDEDLKSVESLWEEM